MDATTLAACTGATAAHAEAWATPISSAMSMYQIETPARQAAFLAQIGHESGGMNWTHELWGPTDAQKAYEPPSSKATQLGNTQPGDGYLFRGRGLIQITGRANYDAVGRALCLDCTAHPDLLSSDPSWAAQSAAWWWQQRGLNELADAGNFEAITRRINGGLNGQENRLRLWALAKQALGVSTHAEV